MNNNEFSIVLQTILEKNGIKKELSEIQKIVDKDTQMLKRPMAQMLN